MFTSHLGLYSCNADDISHHYAMLLASLSPGLPPGRTWWRSGIFWLEGGRCTGPGIAVANTETQVLHPPPRPDRLHHPRRPRPAVVRIQLAWNQASWSEVDSGHDVRPSYPCLWWWYQSGIWMGGLEGSLRFRCIYRIWISRWLRVCVCVLFLKIFQGRLLDSHPLYRTLGWFLFFILNQLNPVLF